MKFKYVMFDDGNFVILPVTMNHSDVLRIWRDIASAGFIHMSDEISVSGKSDSLRVVSDPEDERKIKIRGGLT